MGSIDSRVLATAIVERFDDNSFDLNDLVGAIHYGQKPKGDVFPSLVFMEIDREHEHVLDAGVYTNDHNVVVVEFMVYSRDRSLSAEHDDIVDAVDAAYGCTAPTLSMPGYVHISSMPFLIEGPGIESGAWASNLSYTMIYDKEA